MNTPVDVAGRISAILRAVAGAEPTGARTSDLARVTGLARPTAHRLLTALLAEGLVDRDTSGRWLLGPELYLLGQTAAPRYDVTALAQPIVRQLAQVTGESAFFSARRGNETVCLLREDGSFPVRSHVLYEGIRFPLGVASAGMVILAFLPPAETEAYLTADELVSSYGESHSAARIRERLRHTQRDGYAVNGGLLVEGSWGLGAAVFDGGGSARWALSLTGIEQRISPRRRELGNLLLQQAHALTQAIAAARPGR